MTALMPTFFHPPRARVVPLGCGRVFAHKLPRDAPAQGLNRRFIDTADYPTCPRCASGRVDQGHAYWCRASSEWAPPSPPLIDLAPVLRRLAHTACGANPILQAAVCRGLDVSYRRMGSGSLFWVGGVRSNGHPWLVTGTSVSDILRGTYAYRPDRDGD